MHEWALPRRCLAAAVATMIAAAITAATAGATPFSNTTPITIPDFGTASPYPSTVTVSGLSAVTNVRVTLNGFSHTYTNDIGVLLVAPGGQNVVLMDAAGNDVQPACSVSNLTLTFNDAAAAPLPNDGCFGSGTYKPSNYFPADTFSAPAPSQPYGTALADLDASTPNGTWSLYVEDFDSKDSGSISGGWSLDIGSPTAVRLNGFRATLRGNRAVLRWRTATEADLLGFNLYRVGAGKLVRLNRTLITGVFGGTAAGHAYSFLDRAGARGAVRYRLQAVGLDGARTWVGTATTAASSRN